MCATNYNLCRAECTMFQLYAYCIQLYVLCKCSLQLVNSIHKNRNSLLTSHWASLSRVRIWVAVVHNQGRDSSCPVLFRCLRQSFIHFISGSDVSLCCLLSHLCWWWTRGFFPLSDLWNLSIACADFWVWLSASNGGAGFRFDSCTFADQGAVWGAQGFGHCCFFPLQAKLMKQTACSASGCGRGGAEPRTRGDLLPLAVLLVLIGWLEWGE